MWTLVGTILQIALGAWVLMSRRIAWVTSVGMVISTLPAMKASMAVARLVMIGKSIPSRYGLPLRQ